MRRRNLPASLACAALLAGAAACGAGEEPAPSGRIVYERHCASCHGLDGRGAGPVAESLDDAPPDLTRLAARNGGRFDERAVMTAIDGRREIEEHGTKDMPVWGAVFESDLMGQQYRRYTAFLRIRDITDYLRSIQQPAREVPEP